MEEVSMKTNDPSRPSKLNQPELKVYSSLELPIHTKKIDLTKPTCVQSRQSTIHTDDRHWQAINLTDRPKHNVLRHCFHFTSPPFTSPSLRASLTTKHKIALHNTAYQTLHSYIKNITTTTREWYRRLRPRSRAVLKLPYLISLHKQIAIDYSFRL